MKYRSIFVPLYLILIICGVALLPTPALAQSSTESRSRSMDNAPVCRIGTVLNTLGAGSSSDISSYDMTSLNAGWYNDLSAQLNPTRPNNMAYAQVVRIMDNATGGYISLPANATIQAIANENPGSDWFIGNEPDRIEFQYGVLPSVYATAYHDLYQLIKAADPTARLFPGGIVQPTELRLAYLDLVLESYAEQYETQLPADGWTIHNYILNEASCDHYGNDLSICWGAGIPPGIGAVDGMRIGIGEHSNLERFQLQIFAFRVWMKTNGYTNLPLYVSEMGILLPDWYQPAVDFSPDAVNQFMNGAFDFMVNAIDEGLGYPEDDFRLVQRFAWYSINDYYVAGSPYYSYNGALFNPNTFVRTAMGDNFASYIESNELLAAECIPSAEVLGDVNCDNDITAVDALFILQHDVGLRTDSEGCPLEDDDTLNVGAGDVDDNGLTNAIDALFILQCEVGLANPFCSDGVVTAERRVAGSVDLSVVEDGDSVTVYANPNLLDIGAGTFELTYDNHGATVQSCTVAGKGGCNIETLGLVRFNIVDAYGLDESQPLAHITFDSDGATVNELEVTTLVNTRGNNLAHTTALSEPESAGVDERLNLVFMPIVGH